MKKLTSALLCLLLFPLISLAEVEYKEGVHYEIVKQTATAKPEVMEFFSFYCPHCYSFESVIHQLKDHLPEGVDISKNHASFLGGQMGVLMSQAFATAQILKVDEMMTEVLFNAIQHERLPIKSRDDIRDLFIENGVEASLFDGAFDSFPVMGLTAQMTKNLQSFKISGVPAVVVNGKFKVMTGDWIKSYDDYNQLIIYLIGQE